MAAITRSRLSYLFTNFANTLAIQTGNFHKTRQALFHCSSFLFGNEQMIKMPSLSPTMTEGKIIKWLKKEGDTIAPGDVLCDIETDKAVISMETEEEGILAKIVIPENTSNIKVGSLIAVMVPPGEDWKNVDIPKEEVAPKAEAVASANIPKESETQRTEKTVVSGPSTIPITMPSLSPTMTAGTIVKWLKKEGDPVAPGDVLCDIQTDKAVMSLEAEEEGILAKIIVPDDSKDIDVGTLIAVIVPQGEDWKSVTVTSAPVERKKEVSQPQFMSSSTAGASEVRGKSFGPAVKSLLSAYQLESGLIKPTGKGNRILKEDVLQYIKDNNLEKKPPKAVPAPSKSDKVKPEGPRPKNVKDSPPKAPKYKDIEVTNMRKVIAKRMLEAKENIPHSYCTIKCNIDDLVNVKTGLNKYGIDVTVTDLLTKATVLALQMRPRINATYVNNEVRLSQTVDVCLAVATEKGLYTPIIKDAGSKTVEAISEERRALAVKAREGKLKPEEYQGGTFTISNLGMFGITQFKAVINAPQCAILAVGGAIENLNAELKPKKQLMLTLSSDGRVVSQQEAAEFMMTIKYFVENPKIIMLGLSPSLAAKS